MTDYDRDYQLGSYKALVTMFVNDTELLLSAEQGSSTQDIAIRNLKAVLVVAKETLKKSGT